MSDDTTPIPLRERTTEGLLHQRILMLDTALDDEIGSHLCARMVMLAAEDPAADIALD